MKSIYSPKRAITFKKYLASVVSIKFLPKVSYGIKYKFTFRQSNSPNIAELMVNELTKSISKKLPIFLFLPDLSLIVAMISRAYKQKAR